jgi:elongator complex protein 3
MISLVPEYCRVMRIMREIPKDKIVEESVKLDLRKDIEEKLRSSGVKINEIRMREIGFNKEDLNLDLKLKITEYPASNGKEFFLQFVNKDNILFGLLRLRIVKDKAIVRELHVYGQAIKLGEKIKGASQHKGIGKLLMNEAEEIAHRFPLDDLQKKASVYSKLQNEGVENKIKKLYVISGVGVRGYYRKLGYSLEGNYMVKEL